MNWTAIFIMLALWMSGLALYLAHRYILTAALYCARVEAKIAQADTIVKQADEMVLRAHAITQNIQAEIRLQLERDARLYKILEDRRL